MGQEQADALEGDRRGVVIPETRSERSSSHRIVAARAAVFLFNRICCTLPKELP
jgi:hypothetical protein